MAKPAADVLQGVPGFLTKTYDIFSRDEHQEFCGWGSKGESIVIRQVEYFAKNVLPKYFKHSNFQSFVRQLNMYDFRKTQQDPNNGEFYHPYFKFGRQDLLINIKRKANTKEATTTHAKPAKTSRSAPKQKDVVTPLAFDDTASSLLEETEITFRPPSSKVTRSSHFHRSAQRSAAMLPVTMSKVDSPMDSDPYLGFVDDSGSFLSLENATTLQSMPSHLDELAPNSNKAMLLREADNVMMDIAKTETSRGKLEYRVNLLESSTKRLEGENLALKHMVEESRAKQGVMQARLENVLRTLFNLYTKSGKLQGVSINRMLEDAGIQPGSVPLLSSYSDNGGTDTSLLGMHTPGGRPYRYSKSSSSSFSSDLGGHELIKLSSFDTAAARITAPAHPILPPGSKPTLERQTSLDWFSVKEDTKDDSSDGFALTRQASIATISTDEDVVGLKRPPSSSSSRSSSNINTSSSTQQDSKKAKSGVDDLLRADSMEFALLDRNQNLALSRIDSIEQAVSALIHANNTPIQNTSGVDEAGESSNSKNRKN